MKLRTLGILPLAMVPTLACAGTPVAAAAEAPKERSAYDRLWDLATLYSNKENPVLQKLAFTGRAHVDLFQVDNDLGEADDWNFRRLRLGAKATLFNDFTLHGEIDADGNGGDPFYIRLTEASLAWKLDDMLNIKVGKQSMYFTLDGSTSSRVLLTLERSNLANNIWNTATYLPGITVSGESDTWNYNLGVFSNGTQNPEFGEFDASWTTQASLGRRFGEWLGADDAGIRVDYVYQDPTEETTFTRRNEHVGSLVFDWTKGPWAFASDVSASTGFGSQSDLFGVQLMPGYYLIEDKLQAVLRYTYVASSEDEGVRYGRYDNEVTSLRGDAYQEFYAGLNYYLYGHKLKLQGGVQYSTMDGTSAGDVEGWQASLGLRMYW